MYNGIKEKRNHRRVNTNKGIWLPPTKKNVYIDKVAIKTGTIKAVTVAKVNNYAAKGKEFGEFKSLWTPAIFNGMNIACKL